MSAIEVEFLPPKRENQDIFYAAFGRIKTHGKFTYLDLYSFDQVDEASENPLHRPFLRVIMNESMVEVLCKKLLLKIGFTGLAKLIPKFVPWWREGEGE